MELADLKELLMGITQCSATFIAIIGGLVTSKAINDNTEVSTLKEQIRKIDIELSTLQAKHEGTAQWLAQQAAIDFVHDNFQALIQDKPLQEVYDATARCYLSLQELQPYWDSGKDAIRSCISQKSSDASATSLNEDGIPQRLAEKMSDYQKELCVAVMDKIDQQVTGRKSQRQLGEDLSVPEQISYETERKRAWNQKLDEEDDIRHEIDKNMGTQDVLRERMELLQERSTLRSGRWVFLVMAVLDVILPMVLFVLAPYMPDAFRAFAAALTLALFACGILTTTVFLTGFSRKPDKSGKKSGHK